MAQPEIYTQALTKFNNTYGLKDFDLAQLENSDAAFRFINGNDGSTAGQTYTRLATRALSLYFEKITNPKETGSNDLSAFDPTKFLSDFEDLAAAKFRSKLEMGDTSTRKRWDGASLNELQTAFDKCANSYNKSLPTLWKDNIKSGNTKIEDMNKVTDNLFEKLYSGHNNKDKLTEELNTLVAAHDAMKQLRESKSRTGIRGFFWRLFNGARNEQEEHYYDLLRSQVTQLKAAKQYDIDKVSKALAGKTVFGKEILSANQKEATQSNKAPAVNTEQKSQDINKEPTIEKVTDMASAMKLVNNTDHLKSQVAEIIKDYPVPSYAGNSGLVSASNIIPTHVERFWDAYNRAKDDTAKENVVKQFAESTFYKMYNVTTMCSSMTDPLSQKLILTQKLTDFVLKTYSPIATDSKYEKYGENYNLQTVEPNTLKSEIYYYGMDNEVKEALEQAKLERLGKVHVDTSKDFDDKEPTVTDKINELDEPAKVINKGGF